jgi:magnesium chelatase subunit I
MSFTLAQTQAIKTLADLKAAGYVPRSVKEELRYNLIAKLKKGESPFPGIWGYEDTVIPEVERAILSMHNINFLGLRGQAKTRMARMMVGLLDEYIPIIAGSELNDDPLAPISRYGKDQIDLHGNQTPIEWLHRDERYTEKLATPDVSVADLIGDADPIKAATLKLPYSDERVLHFGLIPRAHRGIFVINELPDLQARIQVALFNILQEGDIQIRGFRKRVNLDILFVFTANPEDYTNRGSIVTPLKDRIESQILTHYPKSIEIGRRITEQEAHIKPEQESNVTIPNLAYDLIEQIALEARKSDKVDVKSGVSARLTISALENLASAAERRALLSGQTKTQVRVADLWAIIPSITGKVELVYEGEQEGAGAVAQSLIGKAIRSMFLLQFPHPERIKKRKGENPYQPVINWFGEGKTLEVAFDESDAEYANKLLAVPGLQALAEKFVPDADGALQLFWMEFILHGLSEYSAISRQSMETGLNFADLLGSMFSNEEEEEN